MLPKLIAATVSALTLLALAVMDADAGPFRRRPRQACQVAASPAPAAMAAYPAASPAADPSGFVGWLNGVRARAGLRPVAWDPALASDAAANSARGFGHAHMGRARRQNAGMGDLGSVQAAWLSSPAHSSALLDPSITLVGLANVGGVWTFAGL